MSPGRPGTPTLDQLTQPERGALLGELLAIHPELLAETENLARNRLATEDSVAEALEWALRGVDSHQVESRAGRIYGRGYVHENEAASELLEEELAPFLTDLTRRAALGLTEARLVGV